MEYNIEDEDFEENSERRLPIYFVGVYLTDRVYGGPEEGGWWYDCGELVTEPSFYEGLEVKALPEAFLTIEEAYHSANKIQESLDKTVNVGRRPKSSVLSEGEYEALVMEGSLPNHYPERRPFYE